MRAFPLEHDLLRSFSPLDSLKPDNLRAVAEKSVLVKFNFGHVLFSQGTDNTKTVYLVSGSVVLQDGGRVVGTVKAGTPEARHPLDAGAIHRHAAKVVSGQAECLIVDTRALDVLLTWDQTGTYQVDELRKGAGDGGNGDDWMVRLLQSPVFQRIPPANIQTMFMRLNRVDCRAGETVIRQGESGDYFYVVVKGRCAVTRDMPLKGQKLRLAELGIGDTFGEEALIADSRRNASVEMLTDGVLMRLDKADFQTLCNEPLLQWISPAAARRLVADGARWLDVRLPSEVQNFGIQGALNIPLFHLRNRLDSLQKDVVYVVCCDTGRRSSVAAFLLGQHGFEARVLEGGLAGAPSPPATAMHGPAAAPLKKLADAVL